MGGGVVGVSEGAIGSMSLAQLLELLPDLEADVDASNARLRACVALLRERRASWREIGETLGVSRQAAWQRFHESATRQARTAV
jgi:hypothetical protein